MTKPSGMRPQDIVVLLGILAMGTRPWRQNELAQKVCLSPAEVTQSLERSRRAGLINETKRGVRRRALLEFIEHGLRYVYPVEPGAIVRGFATAHSAPPLASPQVHFGGGADTGGAPKIQSHNNDVYVWPHDEGTVRGQAIVPLYPTVPQAAKADSLLYEMLALVDAVRVGWARERKLAIALLDKIMRGQGASDAEQS